MEAKIYIRGRINAGETLKDVVRQFKSYAAPTSVHVDIESVGGSKVEGDAVHYYLKNLGIPVTTRTGKAYSIAAKIFAAGEKRIVKKVPEAIMIHFARTKVEGTAEYLELVAAELRKVEREFTDFYSKHLAIDKDTVSGLLDRETFLSGEEAVAIGFATEIEDSLELVAELDINKLHDNNMAEKKSRSFLLKLKDLLTAELGAAEESPKGAEQVAELVLQDATGTEVVFPDVEENSTPEKGDRATIGGAKIEDGSYVMPSLANATVVFLDGVIDEIKEKEAEPEPEPEPTEEEVAAELAQVKEKLKDKLKVEVLAEAKEAAKVEVMEELKAEHSKDLAAKDSEIVALKAKIGGSEFEQEKREQENKNKNKNMPKAAVFFAWQNK